MIKRNKENNIVRADLKELEKNGWRAAKPIKDRFGNVQPPKAGNLLCLSNKSQDLWADLSLNDIKISRVNCEKFLIMEI